ncbi:MAG: carboxypeptidase regulatory-like domain-containing protein [Candidatus Magnetomorum sp.]|nr:carboxypeptidase regulatory-like domain-containing protein [Candidatus Magnetomorum sp.]
MYCRLKVSAPIKGYVFIENNGIQSPAPDGTLVKVWSDSTQSSGSCKTDQNGFYEIFRLDYEIVDYRISAFHKDYMPAYYQSDQTTVYAIKDSGTVFPSSENRNMVLKKGLVLKGNVSCDNISVENVVVKVFSDETGTSGNTISSKMPSGVNNYTITGLSPGIYTIQAFSEDYINFITSTVLIDTDMQYDILLEQPHYSINGFICNFNPIQSVTINIESASLQWRKEQDLIIDNRNFLYTINKLKPAPDYTISIISPAIPKIYYNSGQDASTPSPVDLMHGNISDINFVFPDNIFDIRGHILFPENAVSGDKVFVQAISDKSGIYLGTQVLFQGSNPVPYAIQGLIQSEDYLVSLLSEKYPTQYFSSVFTRAEAQAVSIMTASASGIDFTLNSGINVSGLVYLNANPEFDIEITAQSNQWIKTTKSKLDGSFVLYGLPINSNFILMAKKQNCPPVYYNNSGTIIRNIQKATHLWTGNENISDLQINIVDGDIIRGIVMDRQNLPVSNMQVSAWSPIHGSGNSSFTDANGLFVISGLNTGMDYIVSVETGGSNYLPQQKENISSLSDSITFFLDQGYTISGIVKDEQNVPIEGVIVNIQSDMLSITKRQVTDKNGQYQIIGLPASYDYFIKTVSKKEDFFSEYMADQIHIQSNQVLDITLLSADQISGYVLDKTNQPIENVNIIVTSEGHNYQGKTITDNEGFYELMDLPDANDFIIRALHPLYCEQSIINQHADSDIIFYLEEGNSIHGSIKDSNGLPVSNASVCLHSQSINIRKDALSDDLGKFQIDGLITSQNNNPIDYILEVYINNILMQTKPAIYVGDDVQFTIHFESLSGVIQDMNGVPVPDGLVPIVYILEENSEVPFVLHADETGSFQVNQLSSEKKYRILVQAGNIAEWIGNDGTGVQDTTNAQLFAPGETIVFRLTTSW